LPSKFCGCPSLVVCIRLLWVIRNGEGLKEAVAGLESIIASDLPHLSIQTQTRTYDKEWIDSMELKRLALILLASARSALLRTESRGVHYRADYPKTDKDRWLKETIVRQVNQKLTLRTCPITVTRMKPPEKVQFRGRDSKRR